MYLTVDCAKLNEDGIILYEFYDESTDNDQFDYYDEKIKELRKLSKTVYVICYETSDNPELNNISVIKFTRDKEREVIFNRGSFETFKNWYISENGDGQLFDSKEFGDILNEGDRYVEQLLTNLVNCDMTKDNNGRKLIIPALEGLNTHFFDFDLLHSKNKFILEFLKNDTHNKKVAGIQKWDLSNGETHPNRYWYKNKRKFITLWEASKILDSELYLLSYSDNNDEPLHLMKVNNISNDGIDSDIGYKLSYDEFITWLNQMGISIEDGSDYLTTNNFPQMVRDERFWGRDTAQWKSDLKNF